MNTKFDIEDEVFITGRITGISLNNLGTKYVVKINGTDYYVKFDEKELLLKKKVRGI